MFRTCFSSCAKINVQSVGPTVVVINMSVPAVGGQCVDSASQSFTSFGVAVTLTWQVLFAVD